MSDLTDSAIWHFEADKDDARVGQLFARLEMALYGKTGNTFRVDTIEAVRAVLRDALSVEAQHTALLAALASLVEMRGMFYDGDTGRTQCWRQCRYCRGYADGPVGSQPIAHCGACPVADLERVAALLKDPA